MKRNKNQMRTNEEGKKGLAEYIALIILRAQEKWAKGMQWITSGLSTRSLKAYVITVAVIMASYSSFIVYSAIWQSDNAFPKIQSIHRPLMPVGTIEYKNHGDTLVLLRMKKFHEYLDSLGRSEAGRKVRDSFLQQRPGLMDSLYHIEELLK